HRQTLVSRLTLHAELARLVRPAALDGAHRSDRDHHYASHGCEHRPAPSDRYHTAVHLVRTVEPVRRAGGDGGVGERGAGAENGLMRNAECGMRSEPNAECGMRNAEWQRGFRFAIRPFPYTPHSEFRIPHSAR